MLHIFGFNHQSAPIEAREEAFFGITQPLVALQQITPLDELVTLTTCNRTELITTASNVDKIRQWLSEGTLIQRPQMIVKTISGVIESLGKH